MAQAKIEAYMDRHRLGPLFEDLMNRVLRDLPEEPLVYILRTVYKKAGMEIPQDIRYGGLKKSVDLATRSASPERASRISGTAGDASASRDYERPWLKSKARPRRSVDGGDHSATRTGRKRPDWQGDTKVMATSFDELWDNPDSHARDPSPGKKSRLRNDTRSSWAAVGLEGGEGFKSGEYHGPSHRPQVKEADLLAGEIVRVSSGRDEATSTQSSAQPRAFTGVSAQRLDSERHRRELQEALRPEPVSRSAQPVGRRGDDCDVEDDALELLEDADDLRREGVKSVSKDGVKLSKIMRTRGNEPCVKLNINLSPRTVGGRLKAVDSLQSMEGYESDTENVSPMSGRRQETDDEFESVSQVTGPRRPVWNVPDSDGEAATLPSSGHRRHKKHRHGNRQDLLASAPEAFQRVTFNTRDLEPNQSWSPGLNLQAEQSSPEPDLETDLTSGRSRGWEVPDDSDAASVQDWNQRVKGRKRDLRSY